MPNARRKLIFPIIFAVFAVCFVVSFSVGRFFVPVGETLNILFGKLFGAEPTYTPEMRTVILNIRLPRIIAVALVGAVLSISGAVYQGIFKNPLVSPDILGSSAGSGFGAALAILLSLGTLGVTALSFVFGIIAVIIAYLCASRFKFNPALGLILAGIMAGSLFSAGTSFLKLIADPKDQLPAITYWLLGSFAAVRTFDLTYFVPLTIIGTTPLMLLSWRMNTLMLGDDDAKAVGINTTRLRTLVIICATLITAAAVSIAGMIGWVGLVVPHLVRSVVGSDFRKLLPACMLLGAAFLLVVDDIARTVAPTEIPIGILTAFVGAPFFIYLLVKK